MSDIYRNCRWRKDRACGAAPYYGTADCDFVVDRDECPEPLDAVMSLRCCPNGGLIKPGEEGVHGLCTGCPMSC